MAIPYCEFLSWNCYLNHPDLPKNIPLPASTNENLVRRAIHEVSIRTIQQIYVRGIQFVRDGARLVLKVPLRAMKAPIFLEKNWKERERAKINVKLTGYSFVQLLFVPVKFLVALTAIVTLAISLKHARGILDASDDYTSYLDGRASQLEALKEVGRVNAKNREEYEKYKTWLYTINPRVCRKISS